MRYFDASALAKRYLREKGSVKVRRLLSAGPAATSRYSAVEIASALARRVREGLVTDGDRERALTVDVCLKTHVEHDFRDCGETAERPSPETAEVQIRIAISSLGVALWLGQVGRHDAPHRREAGARGQLDEHLRASLQAYRPGLRLEHTKKGYREESR